MMDIKIYQINLSRDDDRVAFLGLSQLDKFQESSKVNSEIYDKVFEGAVEVDTLEGVYQMFNCDCPGRFFRDTRCRFLMWSRLLTVKMLASISVTALAFSL